MAVEIPKTNYSGKIREIKLGKGAKAITVGGENSFPFYLFEGTMPHQPKIAMEVQDYPPDEWPKAAVEPFTDVMHDPVAWAKKCIHNYGAEMIALQLVSTDPNGMNRGADEAAAIVKKVSDAIDVPLIVWGTANHEKDTQVLTKVCEVCQDKRLIIGPVEEKDYKKIAAAAIAYKHTVVDRLNMGMHKKILLILLVFAAGPLLFGCRGGGLLGRELGSHGKDVQFGGGHKNGKAPIIFDTTPFDASNADLPPHYNGHDITEVYASFESGQHTRHEATQPGPGQHGGSAGENEHGDLYAFRVSIAAGPPGVRGSSGMMRTTASLRSASG